MLLFRLADVPRTLRRLTPPIPAVPDTAGIDVGDALNGLSVDRMLRPALLDAASARVRARIARVIALYATAEGQPRSAVDALAPQIEEIFGDYRLARCVARTIEDMGYHYAPPPRALSEEPVALRAHCYRRAQEIYGGYVPRARRDTFLGDVAAELGTTPERLEEALWADRPGAALLRAGPAGDDVSPRDDNPPPAVEAIDPAGVIARYNVAALATILSASAWVTISLPATETVALKELYRHAKARHVGVEIALRASSTGEGAGDLLAVTLYGPGSRALVRGRRVQSAGNSAEPSVVSAGQVRADRPTIRGDAAEGTEGDEEPEDVPGGTALDGASVPAPGGPPVASVVSRLLRRHPRAVRDGWARLLGPDHRLLHVPLDADALAALRGAGDDRSGEGEAEAVSYDSGVEETFARAFHAAEAGGPLGVARGWSMEREPRVVIVDGVVFLPDYSFRRGDVEVFCELVGYYTEDYLARKRRKLAHLRGRIALLLVVDEERAPLFSAAGFPLVTYRAGRGVGVTDVVQALDAAFDPFARRRARAVRTLGTLCVAEGPRLSEEELCATLGCAGRGELTEVWSNLVAEMAGGQGDDAGTQGDSADTRSGGARQQGGGSGDDGHATTRGHGAGAQGGDAGRQGIGAGTQSGGMGAWNGEPPSLKRRFVPGYGLAASVSVAQARVALVRLLDEAGGAVPLEDALACCEQAGLPDADEALIDALGGVVVRSGLFGEAQVHRPGAEAEQALTEALSAGPPSRRRRRT